MTQTVIYLAAGVSTANCMMLGFLIVTLWRRNHELVKQAKLLAAIVDLLVAFYPDHTPDHEARRQQAINIQSRARELISRKH